MNVNTLIEPIGDLMVWTFGIFEFIGNSFNWLVIIGGFIGLFIWLFMQKKYNAEAENNPDQIK